METEVGNEVKTKETVAGKGFFQRIAGVILSPTETFKLLVEKPGMIFPILAVGLTSLIVLLLTYDAYMEMVKYIQEMAYTESLAKMGMEFNSEEKAKLEVIFQNTKNWIPATAVLNPLISWLLGSFILFALVKIFRGQGSFRQVLSITGYAYTVMILGSVLSVIMYYITGNLFDASLAVFFKGMKETLVYGFLKGIDVFTVWQYCLITIGITVMSGLKRMKAGAIVFGIFVISCLMQMSGYKYM